MSFLDACEEMQLAIAEKIVECINDEVKSAALIRYIDLSLSISEITSDHYDPPVPPNHTKEARTLVKYRGFLSNLLLDASECDGYDEDSFCQSLGLLANSHPQLKDAINAVEKDSNDNSPYVLFEMNPNMERQISKIKSMFIVR